MPWACANQQGRHPRGPSRAHPAAGAARAAGAGEAINALLAATRALSERSAARFHEGLQPAAFHIARWLYAFGPARPSAIAEAVGMDRSSTSTLIGRMRTLGLLESRPDPGDRRSVIVALSETGRARTAASLADRAEQFERRTRRWSAQDVRTLARLLRRLTDDSGKGGDPGTSGETLRQWARAPRSLALGRARRRWCTTSVLSGRSTTRAAPLISRWVELQRRCPTAAGRRGSGAGWTRAPGSSVDGGWTPCSLEERCEGPPSARPR